MKIKKFLPWLLLVIALSINACAGTSSVENTVDQATELPENPTQAADPTDPPVEQVPAAVDAAVKMAAAQTGLDESQVLVVEYDQVEWPDACLGLAIGEVVCAQIITPGYGGVLQAGDEQFEFRTDQVGVTVRLLPGAASGARNFLAQEFGVDPSQIQFNLIEAVDFPDACLGVTGRGDCAQVITPGYQVGLVFEGQSFLVHTDRSGQTIILAGTPDQPSAVSQMLWTGELEGDCYQTDITSESLIYGPCDGEVTTISFISSPRLPEFQELTRLFGLFINETPVGDIQLTGPGTVSASSLQQRMAAEWARMVTAEQLTTDDPGANWALQWHREASQSGSCEEIAIDWSGLVVASSCQSATPVEHNRARLTTIQLKQFYDWIDTVMDYEFERTELLESGSVTTKLSFKGRGETQVLELQQREMDQFAQELLTHLSQPQEKAEIDAARQVLNAYLTALNEARYEDAAGLFGGDIKPLRDMNPEIAPEDYAALFGNACTQNGFICDLSVLREVSAAKISPTTFRFVVETKSPDGDLFVLGSCCGTDPSGEPMVTQFEFYVEKVNDEYLVTSLPIYSA